MAVSKKLEKAGKAFKEAIPRIQARYDLAQKKYEEAKAEASLDIK